MLLPNEDLKLGQDAYERVKEYGLLKKARLWTWFGLFVWSFQTSLFFLFRPNYFKAAVALLWLVAAGFILRSLWKSKRRYIQDLATLDELRKRYGSEISFEEENTVTNAEVLPNTGEKPIFTWRGLIAFSILMSVVFIYSKFIRPLLFPH